MGLRNAVCVFVCLLPISGFHIGRAGAGLHRAAASVSVHSALHSCALAPRRAGEIDGLGGVVALASDVDDDEMMITQYLQKQISSAWTQAGDRFPQSRQGQRSARKAGDAGGGNGGDGGGAAGGGGGDAKAARGGAGGGNSGSSRALAGGGDERAAAGGFGASTYTGGGGLGGPGGDNQSPLLMPNPQCVEIGASISETLSPMPPALLARCHRH